MKVAAKSDAGKVRPINEDSYALLSLPQGQLCILADGMGGYNGGEVASRMTVDGIAKAFSFADPIELPVSEEKLGAIIHEVNASILERSRADAALAGMGTTLSMAVICGDEALLAHIGDSRIYLWRDGELTQLTRDHTLIAELIRLGEITEEQALTHPHRHVLTRALGVESDVQVDFQTVQLLPGDRLLLCSDGLYNDVSDAQIADWMAKDLPLQKLCDQLFVCAMQAGGTDNITVVCAEKDGDN